MDNTPAHSPAHPLSDQVVNWLLLLRSGQATPRDYADFLAWRDADPSHENAWQQLSNALGAPSSGRLSDAYPLATTGHGSAPREMLSSRGFARRHLFGGILALGACAAAGVYATASYQPKLGTRVDAATNTGERRRYTLADGSQLLLDARSEVNFEFTHEYRMVRLLQGALAVHVAPDAQRPFVVRTAEGAARAGAGQGGRYMVRQQPHRTLVVVHEQDIAVETLSGQRGTTPAGTGLRFGTGLLGKMRTDLCDTAAWENGWIETRGRPLAEVITALRPYYPGSLRVSMAAGGLPVHGRYPLDQPEEALQALERTLPIHVERYTPWFVSIGVMQA